MSPRSRGKHHPPLTVDLMDAGPPPLARGTPPDLDRGDGIVRTTPARAGNTRRSRVAVTMAADHPRSRGEHRSWARTACWICGPPPLARGTRRPPHRERPQGRTTPARAGNTSSDPATASMLKDHPRSRGEQGADVDAEHVRRGPPPLARGTPRPGRGPGCRPRTTPARAGNTMWPCAAACSAPDHPRSRGEHATGQVPEVEVDGPPPLARGTRRVRPADAAAHRTTPARAGNTSGWLSRAELAADHPRSRGEHLERPYTVGSVSGPPPLARGTRRSASQTRTGQRTTPARAGNTAPCMSGCLPRADHPRSRGEHGATITGPMSPHGPPPLARGTRSTPPLGRPGRRTTPARAGNTLALPFLIPLEPDHPRSRGEHRARSSRLLRRSGPPPLARGTPRAHRGSPTRNRTTPARAGNTSRLRTVWSNCADHPRSRGEHRGLRGGRNARPGPPPLARGTPEAGEHGDLPGRTTPARAGNTHTAPYRAPTTPDHPRSRGEHQESAPTSSEVVGPPPLARGTPHPAQARDRHVRTTPARAGNTRRDPEAPQQTADHPRSRGEHRLSQFVRGGSTGPPPLARGTPSRTCRRAAGRRTTPARAGNTRIRR